MLTIYWSDGWAKTQEWPGYEPGGRSYKLQSIQDGLEAAGLLEPWRSIQRSRERGGVLVVIDDTGALASGPWPVMPDALGVVA